MISIRQFPPGKFPHRKIPSQNNTHPDNPHPENPHPDYSNQENSVEDFSHSNNIQPTKFPFIVFTIQIIPARHVPIYNEVNVPCRLLWCARGASHSPAFMVSWTISHKCLPCLPSKWVSPGCSITPCDWHNAGSVGVFYAWHGFSSMESWYYSREWKWNSRTKLCCNVSEKWNASRVSLQGFDIWYIVF